MMLAFTLLVILSNWSISKQLQAQQLHGERIAVLVLASVATIISILLALGVDIPPLFTLMSKLLLRK